MHPYRAQAAMKALKSNQGWAYVPLAKLSSLAFAMKYLVWLYSVVFAQLKLLSSVGGQRRDVLYAPTRANSKERRRWRDVKEDEDPIRRPQVSNLDGRD